MKKLLFLILITGVLFGVFAQAKKIKTDIVKNKFEGGGVFGYTFNNAELQVATTAFTIPYTKYFLETVQKESNKFYFTGEFGYKMSKTTIDGNVPEGMDVYSSDLFLSIDPEIRLYISQEMINNFGKSDKNEAKSNEWEESDALKDTKNKFFIAFGLPINYHNITPQFENVESYTETSVDMSVNLGYDDKIVDIKKISPWAKFQKGLFVYGLFEYRLSETVNNESPDQMPMTFGIAGDYAYELDKLIKNATVKGFLTLKYQMAADAIKILPVDYFDPYLGSYLELSYGVEYAQDILSKINVVSSLSYSTYQLNDSPNDDSVNMIYFNSKLNYYPLPEVNIFTGFDIVNHLSKDYQHEGPSYALSIGASYTFDILTFRNNSTKDNDDY